MVKIVGYSKEQQIGKRFIPKRKDRTKITQKEYDKVVEVHGFRCVQCGATPIEMHHVKFRSQGGKGTWRNLRPLCKDHHMLVHSREVLTHSAKQLHKSMYGEYYWCDKYDLFKMGLIEDPNDDEFEGFMKSQIPKEPEPQEDLSYLFPF